MADPFRMVKVHWRRLLNKQTIDFDGVTLSTDASAIPRSVRTGLFKGSYEDHERKLARRLLKPGDRVLEIGAGIGFVSLLCRKICSAGNVRSYEANPLLEPIIRRNYALNSMEPDLRMRAITLDGAPITFFRNDNIISSSTLERDGFSEKIVVQSEALSEVLAEYRPTVVIMDVEGAEVDLLAQSNLDGVRHVIVEIHPHLTGDRAIAAMRAALVSMGFSVEGEEHKTLLFSR
jgi:FkbM family methyltransferase